MAETDGAAVAADTQPDTAVESAEAPESGDVDSKATEVEAADATSAKGGDKPAAGDAPGDTAPKAEETPDPKALFDGLSDEDRAKLLDGYVKADQWRETMIKDADLRKKIERYNSVEAMAKALDDAKVELSKRPKALKKPDADASPEAVAEYKKSVGAPAEAKAYLEDFSEPDHFSEEYHRPALEEFSKLFYDEDIPTDKGRKLIDAFFDFEARKLQEMNAAAAEQQIKAHDELVKEIGGVQRFEMTVDAARRYGEEAAGAKEWHTLVNTPFADGTRLGDNPAFLRFARAIATDAYGEDLTLVTGDPAALNNAQAEYDQLSQKMRAHFDGSLKGGEKWTTADQQRHAELHKIVRRNPNGKTNKAA